MPSRRLLASLVAVLALSAPVAASAQVGEPAPPPASFGEASFGAPTARSLKAEQNEITLFDSRGRAVAYITLDDEATIYLWEGEPVAYLKRTSDDLHIYNFDGRHLGWLVRGVVMDHDGNGVGFVQGALSTATEFEPFKGFKQFKPFKGFEEFPPFRPLPSGYWSRVPLAMFLKV